MMAKVLLVLFGILLTSCKEAHTQNELPDKVFNGEDVTERIPYMTSLRDSNGRHMCGGTLIHPNVVLTAAHCLNSIRKPVLHIGRLAADGDDPPVFTTKSQGFETRQTTTAIVHGRYRKTRIQFSHDIALLIFNPPSNMAPVRLARDTSSFGKTGGRPVIVLGWGLIEIRDFASVLQRGFIDSMSKKTCKRFHSSGAISNTMICAGKIRGEVGTCDGDSGGPLLQDGSQVGIVSWGIGCAEKESPGVYTSVPKLCKWIRRKINKRFAGSSLPGCI